MSNRILFMTVGTGVGDSEERVRSLAHGLLSSIHHNRPDRVIFFGSDKSRKTVDYISEEAEREGRTYHHMISSRLMILTLWVSGSRVSMNR